MTRRSVARIITAVLLGMILAVEIRLEQVKTIRLGREAFLAAQSLRYTDLADGQRPALLAFIITCILIVAAVIVLYEGIVFTFEWALERVDTRLKDAE